MGDDRTRNAAVQETKQVAPGARGGAMADFTSLINLITTTVRPASWDDLGGPGTIESYRTGVHVDARGELRRVIQPVKSTGLAQSRVEALKANGNTDRRRTSELRKVSLTRLEKYVQLCLAAGHEPSDEMLNLAGLEKIKYVLVYPETGDLVLAGPASDWAKDAEGRLVSTASGRPILQLDDLVTVLRYLSSCAGKHVRLFHCSVARGIRAHPAFFRTIAWHAAQAGAAHDLAEGIAAINWAGKRLRSRESILARAWPRCWSRPTIA